MMDGQWWMNDWLPSRLGFKQVRGGQLEELNWTVRSEMMNQNKTLRIDEF